MSKHIHVISYYKRKYYGKMIWNDLIHTHTQTNIHKFFPKPNQEPVVCWGHTIKLY